MNKQESDSSVAVFEVGPRDGLQNEARILTVEQKLHMIGRLVDAGIREVEIGSFVHPKWVPQMADTDQVATRLVRQPGVRYWALVPNLTGLQRAMDAGLEHVAVFMSSSESHNQNNLNRSIAESLAGLGETCRVARANNLEVRAYVSTVFGCPFEGDVDFARVLEITSRLLDMGAFQISLGDTIGVGKPRQVAQGCRAAIEAFGADQIALHLHDTQGLGLANTLAAFDVGVRNFDSAVGGLGGCPYAPGAAGNLGTEDLLNLLESLDVNTGIDLDAVCNVSAWLRDDAQIHVSSRYFQYWNSLESTSS